VFLRYTGREIREQSASDHSMMQRAWHHRH